MVNGPGMVIFAGRSVAARRNCMSRGSTGPRRRIGPTTRGTMVVPGTRLGTSAGLSRSSPASAVAKRLE